MSARHGAEEQLWMWAMDQAKRDADLHILRCGGPAKMPRDEWWLRFLHEYFSYCHADGPQRFEHLLDAIRKDAV